VFSVPASSSLFDFKYNNLGCWADNINQRAVPSQEGDPLFNGSDYNGRTNAIKKCAQVAAKNEFKVFVLQVFIIYLFKLLYIVCFSH